MRRLISFGSVSQKRPSVFGFYRVFVASETKHLLSVVGFAKA